ncbi:MAG TPA: hypothetical protein VGS27_06630 [Candidatus Sulfotelmatobacter sp.]|nr:hypothetical protein [Candidatus Sulfotelmatobacter sp.]
MSGNAINNTATTSIHPEQFWMRPVSFAGLLRVVQLASEHGDGLRAADLNAKIKEQNIYRTERGTPSPTTLYHCRNTLLRLGVMGRRNSRYFVNRDLPQVEALLSEMSPRSGELSLIVRDAFADLVLRNQDCRAAFFDLFTDGKQVSAAEFRLTAQSVTWNRVTQNDRRTVVLVSRTSAKTVLSSASEIKSVLYGVRYWAREELRLTDEFFRDDRGAVMYPIRNENQNVDATINEILGHVSQNEEWTTFSLPDLAVICCEEQRRPLEILRAAIRKLTVSFPGQVVTVPTSRAFATIAARSRQREELELRVYFRDAQNRYVSHLKIHKSLSEKKQWQAI